MRANIMFLYNTALNECKIYLRICLMAPILSFYKPFLSFFRPQQEQREQKIMGSKKVTLSPTPLLSMSSRADYMFMPPSTWMTWPLM